MASDFDRRRFIKAASTAGLVGLAGCSGGPSGDGGDGSNESDGSDGGDGSDGDDGGDGSDGDDGSDEPVADIGMVYATGGLGDGSFNDQAQQGALEAEEDLNIAFDEAQPDETSEFSSFQQQFAESTDPDYDLVACIGFLQADALSENAEEYSDQDFIIVDDASVDSPNVDSYVFAEHEGSYLAGLMASLLTTEEFSAGAGSTDPDETTLGFVGGVESDLIEKFEAGFIAGVEAGNDDVEVITNYTGSFNEVSAGREAATAMYNDGADIIFHAAGNTGRGVFEAAQEEGRFAIGVDRDQSLTQESSADVILASMVKRVDTAVYESIESVVEGEFSGGDTLELGLDQDGVELVYGDQLGSEIPDAIGDEVATAREEIIAGDIDVPSEV